MPPAATLTPKALALFSAALVALLAISGWNPTSAGTWVLEVAPVIVVLPILWFTHRRFPLTPLLYALIFVHACVLMLGGHYTYAQVPLGFWMEGWLGFSRNNYDRIGHLAQGFIPAMLAREIFIRRSPLAGSRWLPFLVVCFCLAFSAFYELIEFWTALSAGGAATDFLGTQGDVWDTQWDIAWAWIGATLAQLVLARRHDRQLAALATQRGAGATSRPRTGSL